MGKKTISNSFTVNTIDDAVTYGFVFTEAFAKADASKTITGNIKGYAYKYVGDTRTPLVNTIIRYGYIIDDSSTYADTTTSNSGFFDTEHWFDKDNIDDYAKGSPSIFAAIQIGGVIVHVEYIAISLQGQTGGRGKTGRFYYYAQEWSNNPNVSYAVTDTEAPYFYYNDNYWIFNPTNNGTYTMSSMGTPSSSNVNWELMVTDFKYLITEAIFGKYAHFGSFIINEDWMLSQYGELVQPNGNIITVNASNVNTKYSGNATVVLNGNHTDNGIIVYKVSFNVSSSTTINITLTTSSENNYDFGAVGKVDNDSLLSATASSIKDDTGSVTLLKISGNSSSTVSTSISINAGQHYLYIGYFKDRSTEAGNDNASFDISGAAYDLTEAKKTSGMSMSGGSRSVVPYGWFDPTDPEVNTLPTSGYKFRPAFAVDGLTGETYQQNAHIKGTITATGGSIAGDLDVTGDLNVDVTGGLNVKNSSNVIKVKINGGSVSTGSSPGEITIVDAEGFYVKRGSEGFRLTTNGFQRWNSTANSWVNFYGGRYVRTVTSFTYTIKLNDDLIIAKPYSSNQRTYLPKDNVPDGKIITIINAGAYGLLVNGNGHDIIGASVYSEVTLNINDRMEFIYSKDSSNENNSKWYANYMPKVDNNS